MTPNETTDLVPLLGEKLHIVKGQKEPVPDWQFRVLYSALGLGILSSLYDRDEEYHPPSLTLPSVSIQHVEKRGIELIEAYLDSYPDAFPDDIFKERKAFVEAILKNYTDTGYILHQPYRLFSSPPVSGSSERLFITRGFPPWETHHMSGLGSFTDSPPNCPVYELHTVFHLESTPITSWWKQLLLQCRSWEQTESLPDGTEYIRLPRQYAENYWISRMPKSGITLCRNSVKDYKLVKREKETFLVHPLPDWRVRDKEYLRIALALHNSEFKKPDAFIRHDQSISHIHLSYLLPPFEQNFFQLFSWPLKDQWKNPWRRTVCVKLLPVIKRILDNLGFNLMEE